MANIQWYLHVFLAFLSVFAELKFMNKNEHTSLTFDFTNNRPITLIEYIIQKICLN